MKPPQPPQPRQRRAFGTVKQLPSGRYQAFYCSPADNRRHYGPRTFLTAREADDWLTKQRAAIIDGQWLAPELGRVTLTSYGTDWLLRRQEQGTLKPATLSLYASHFDNHIQPYLGEFLLAAITPATVAAWWADLAKRTGATARSQTYRLLHVMMADAVRAGAIPAQPCNIRGASQDRHPERQPLTPAEVDTLADAMPERWRFMVRLAAWSGLRFGELVELRRRDVRTDQAGASTITVERAAKYVDGRWIVGSPKTYASRRTVHLPPHLRDALAAHLDAYARAGHDGLVFPTVSGQRLNNSNMSAMIKRARPALGRDNLHFHDLRHTFGTMVAQTGATLRETMDRLGQATPRAAMIYQHTAQGRPADIARKLSALAADATPAPPADDLPDNVIPMRRVA